MHSRFIVAALVAAAAAAPALSHPKLVSSTPAANAKIAATSRLQLNFSEKLVPKLSGADVVMIDMPGMKMKAPTRMSATATVGPDGKSLVVALAKPLPAGTYRLDWHVVSTDTHRVKGTYGFKVG